MKKNMVKDKIKRKILVSVDDGGRLDLGLGDLLLKYRIPAVFYIPPKYMDLTDGQIERLAGLGTCHLCPVMRELFDIGAHTMTHPQDLKVLNDRDVRNEISDSKAYLEKLIKRPVTRFCYPRGRHDKRIREMVKEAGFKEARTTLVMNTDFPEDPFVTATSVHVHPDRKEYKGRSWVEVGYELFDKVIEKGGRFELWGHGWEVEQYNQWEFVEDFFGYMNDEMKKVNYPRKI